MICFAMLLLFLFVVRYVCYVCSYVCNVRMSGINVNVGDVVVVCMLCMYVCMRVFNATHVRTLRVNECMFVGTYVCKGCTYVRYACMHICYV